MSCCAAGASYGASRSSTSTHRPYGDSCKVVVPFCRGGRCVGEDNSRLALSDTSDSCERDDAVRQQLLGPLCAIARQGCSERVVFAAGRNPGQRVGSENGCCLEQQWCNGEVARRQLDQHARGKRDV